MTPEPSSHPSALCYRCGRPRAETPAGIQVQHRTVANLRRAPIAGRAPAGRPLPMATPSNTSTCQPTIADSSLRQRLSIRGLVETDICRRSTPTPTPSTSGPPPCLDIPSTMDLPASSATDRARGRTTGRRSGSSDILRVRSTLACGWGKG